ncbi:MAG: site-specific integrase [Acidobacteria bacterium]|nr:site-specific integrase [Acidobacteriota bacterium]
MELFFPNPECRRRARDGPLGDDIDAFAAWLAAEGYAPFTAQQKLHFAADVSRWLTSRKLAVDDLDSDQIAAFHAAREPQQRRRGDAATGRQLLDLLRVTGRIPSPPSDLPSDDPVERIAQTYERFLLDERGVKPRTVANYLPTVRRFLAERFGEREITLGSLSAQDTNQFILREAQRLGRSTAKLVGTILRSFLRHLHQRGAIPADLAGALPPVTNWSLAGLPKALQPEEIQALLSGCDRNSVAGRRDYAILLLLARLGLRGGEVSALTLDDFDWDAGIVNVSGKGPRREPLPVPCDVGEAVADYLRNGRPSGCPTRRVFVRLKAPHRGFASTVAIDCVVRRALARAHLDPPFKGAHLLRHSLATGMLRNGATLEDIGQILRHRHPETTQIYAKVDLEALRTVAPPWPGGAA